MILCVKMASNTYRGVNATYGGFCGVDDKQHCFCWLESPYPFDYDFNAEGSQSPPQMPECVRECLTICKEHNKIDEETSKTIEAERQTILEEIKLRKEWASKMKKRLKESEKWVAEAKKRCDDLHEEGVKIDNDIKIRTEFLNCKLDYIE